jgi:hypothetical protein
LEKREQVGHHRDAGAGVRDGSRQNRCTILRGCGCGGDYAAQQRRSAVGSRFTIRSEGPAYSRRIVRSVLIGERIDAIETAALLTSELVAEAMAHGSDGPDLFVDIRRGHLHVEVYDSATAITPPVGVPSRDVGPYDVGRSRVRIVDSLATAWGYESRDDVGAFWFDLDL